MLCDMVRATMSDIRTRLSPLYVAGLVGSIVAGLVAASIPLFFVGEQGTLLRIILLVVIGQAHFVIAYLYYIDIIRVQLPTWRRRIAFLGAFGAVVLVYYFVRYEWFTQLTLMMSALTIMYFLVHHVKDMLEYSGKFDFTPAAPTPSVWTIAFSISWTLLFISFAYYILDGSGQTLFTWWLVVPAAILFLYVGVRTLQAATHPLWRATIIGATLAVFSGPVIFQFVPSEDLRLFIVFWHIFMWMFLYPMHLYARNAKSSPPPAALQQLPVSWVSALLKRTRANPLNFAIFYLAMNTAMAFAYVSSAHLQGLSPVSTDMVYTGIFWGYIYFDLWAFAHVTFSFFPKRLWNRVG